MLIVYSLLAGVLLSYGRGNVYGVAYMASSRYAFQSKMGLIGALLLMFGVYASLSFVFVSRHIRYRQDWLTGVTFPAIAAGVSGVVVFLLQLVLTEAAGDLITVLVALVAGVFIYIFLLMALRVIGEAELSRMPLGFFFILLGKNLGIL